MGRIIKRATEMVIDKNEEQPDLILDAEAALSQKIRNILEQANMHLIGGGNDRFLRVLCSLNEASATILTSEMVNLHYSMDYVVDHAILADPKELQGSPLKVDEMIDWP